MAHFGLTTNFSGTINLIARDSEALWLGFFFNETIVGYYKVAQAVINLVILPINPFISTSYPEITRAVVGREWLRLRSLLRRVTAISGAWTFLVAAGLVGLGIPVLFQNWTILGYRYDILYGPEYLPAYPILMILLVGYGFANIFFWNRSLLLALDLPGFAFKVAFYCMLAKVALTIILVPRYGPVMEAGLLSAYFIASVSLILWRGLGEVRRLQAQPALNRVEVE
jgi:O-antigen/teichoic acid export membrane protein